MREMKRKYKVPNITEASKIAGLKYHIFRDRMMYLKIDRKELTQDNIESIKNYTPRKHYMLSDFSLEEKEKVIHYYHLNENNSYRQISKDLSFSKYQISKTIDEYLNNNNCLIAESKINRK